MTGCNGAHLLVLLLGLPLLLVAVHYAVRSVRLLVQARPPRDRFVHRRWVKS
jgi:hypothetical protein